MTAAAEIFAADGIAVAARLAAVHSLTAESAALRNDLPAAYAQLQLVAAALDEARGIVAMVARIVK